MSIISTIDLTVKEKELQRLSSLNRKLTVNENKRFNLLWKYKNNE